MSTLKKFKKALLAQGQEHNSEWDTSNSINMYEMFKNDPSSSQDPSSWVLTNIENKPCDIDTDASMNNYEESAMSVTDIKQIIRHVEKHNGELTIKFNDFAPIKISATDVDIVVRIQGESGRLNAFQLDANEDLLKFAKMVSIITGIHRADGTILVVDVDTILEVISQMIDGDVDHIAAIPLYHVYRDIYIR